MRNSLFFGCVMLSVGAFANAGARPTRLDKSVFFDPHPSVGKPFSQVFSRTVSTRAEGFDWLVKRISGTGSYRLSAVVADRFVFDSRFLYDGTPVASGVTEISRDGSESCWQGMCGRATDASGLIFNSLLWGTPPKKLSVGTTWHVTISTPWELGPVGEEHVTVTALDQASGSVTLQRKGSGEGVFDSDPAQIKMMKEGREYAMGCKPGAAKWSGYATIVGGIVVSDELIVERTLELSSAELGTLRAVQRQYILLNQTPQSSGWEVI